MKRTKKKYKNTKFDNTEEIDYSYLLFNKGCALTERQIREALNPDLNNLIGNGFHPSFLDPKTIK